MLLSLANDTSFLLSSLFPEASTILISKLYDLMICCNLQINHDMIGMLSTILDVYN